MVPWWPSSATHWPVVQEKKAEVPPCQSRIHPVIDLELDRVPSGAAGPQVAVASSRLLSPGDSKGQWQAAVSWLGLDWRQVDLLGKRPLFIGKLSDCLATSGQASKGGRLRAISGLGSWLP